ncbi:hypothetical protein CDAR_56851 [Caerostris darwini]|uniref:Uncharacterized protein n=1 Tax=Caerostris darwini TaxID=1538125 RepID=A0AAV4UMV8_9ARAC|nr:hypothetical protein CDAR_56851 [Caerostris darwini]
MQATHKEKQARIAIEPSLPQTPPIRKERVIPKRNPNYTSNVNIYDFDSQKTNHPIIRRGAKETNAIKQTRSDDTRHTRQPLQRQRQLHNEVATQRF